MSVSCLCWLLGGSNGLGERAAFKSARFTVLGVKLKSVPQISCSNKHWRFKAAHKACIYSKATNFLSLLRALHKRT